MTALLAAAAPPQGVQDPEPKLTPALVNQYVEVMVYPPSAPSTRAIISDCFNNDVPFVRLYIPTPVISTNQPGYGVLALPHASAAYVAPKELFGCSLIQNATVVFVDLKSMTPNSTFDDDAVRIDPKHNEVLFENNRVRVVRVHFESGETGPMVDKRPRVIFARTDSHALVTFPDGHSEPREMKAGAVSFGNAGRQATKNTGTTPLENIVVELKSKGSVKK